ncbi:MAG: hypothetical protein NTW78_00825 [Campylobacterales bacterium]|nr:hypothetical protein [Campylobacterales bacterium]
MKKGIFLLASITMLMLAGCGESSSGATSASSGTSGQTSNTGSKPVTPPVTSNGNVSNTTTANGLGVSLNPSLGTPPPLPAS